MPIRWSARKVAESLDEMERLLDEAEPILRECQAKASETAKLPNLAGYMEQPLMMLADRVNYTLNYLRGRISRVREYIPKNELAKEQAHFEKLVAYFEGDREKAETTMPLGRKPIEGKQYELL